MRDNRPLEDRLFLSAFRATLRRAFDGTGSAKKIARAAHTTPRTVKNWLAGEHVPQAEPLINLMRESDEVCTLILRLADRGDVADLIEARSVLAELETTLARLHR